MFLAPIQLVDAIVSATCRVFGIQVGWFHTRRSRTVMRCRMLCIWIIRQVTHMSTPEIGEYFGIDHSSVVQGSKRIEQVLAADEALRGLTRSIMLSVGFEPKGLLASVG